MNTLPAPAWNKNDRRARILILVFSAAVFLCIMLLSRVKWNVHLPFNVHVFAEINAVLNSSVAILLLLALLAVRRKKYLLHRNIMLTALFLSVLFLLSYIAHHLLAGETRFGDMNHDGVLTEAEKISAGKARIVYYFLLGTHIPLAGIILPFILFTAYRGLTGEYVKHRKLARITWPIWLYVAVTGVIVYEMISPYYH